MAQLITHDDLDDLELSRAGRADPLHVERAEVMIGWATDVSRYELEPGLRRAHLLLAAAEHLQMAGLMDRAIAVAAQASEASDLERFEAAATLISILLERDTPGDRERATSIADEVRRAGSAVDWTTLWQLAESFELAGEHALAERWFVIALRAVERDADHDDADRALLLSGRFRVRRVAGKPEDVLDLETVHLREALGYDALH